MHPHHYTAVPVSSETFASSGFSVWDSPLLRVAIAVQANVLGFVVTCSRFYQLAKLIFERELQEADTDRILARFSSEMRIVLTTAQRRYADAVHILTSSSSPDKTRWLDELRRLCSLLLFEVDEGAAVTLTMDTFGSWIRDVQITLEQFKELIGDIVSFAVASSREANG